MPELPEVETMRRGILGSQGQLIESVEVCVSQYRPFPINIGSKKLSQRLTGKSIAKIDRLGKRILFHLDDQSVLVFEPRMTGLALIAEPPNREHLRVILELSGSGEPQLLFWDRRGLGHLNWFNKRQFESEFGIDRIGPDALDIDVDALRQRLSTSQREIKVALLDQKIVAGVGNLYAAELLFEAEIDPRTRCARLSRSQWQRLVDAMHRILAQAIRYEGSTLSDGTYRNALNQNGSYQNHHQVYAKHGKPCPQCQRPIQRIVQAQRSTFFCPQCQRKSDRSRLASKGNKQVGSK